MLIYKYTLEDVTRQTLSSFFQPKLLPVGQQQHPNKNFLRQKRIFQLFQVGSGLPEKFSVKVGVHQGFVLSPLLFAMVIDEVTKTAKKGWMKQILYADDLVLMGETMEELRENFDEWREALENKGMGVNLGKTKLMVSGMKEETFDSKIDPCDMCGTRVTLTRCYVQHVVSGSRQDAKIRRKLQFI